MAKGICRSDLNLPLSCDFLYFSQPTSCLEEYVELRPAMRHRLQDLFGEFNQWLSIAREGEVSISSESQLEQRVRGRAGDNIENLAFLQCKMCTWRDSPASSELLLKDAIGGFTFIDHSGFVYGLDHGGGTWLKIRRVLWRGGGYRVS